MCDTNFGGNQVSDTAKTKRMFLFFPFTIGLFPVLHLYDVNVDQVTFSMVWPSLLKSIIGVGLCWLLIWLIHREPRRAALTTSILTMLYFGYFMYSGWILQILMIVLATNWLIYFIYKSKSDLRPFCAFMNVASLVAVGTAVFSIGQQLMNPPPMEFDEAAILLSEEQKAMVGTTPNVYYIILDGYGRKDILEEYYRTDNSDFINFLEEQGFWVSKESRANYLRTMFSVPSSLNMTYLDEFIEQNELVGTTDERPALHLMKNSKVRAYMEAFGHKSVGISSGFTGWNMSGAKHYIDQKMVGQNEFQSIVNAQTPVYQILLELSVMSPFEKHRELQISTVDYIPEIPKEFLEDPIFAFIHMMCPHPPFVFLEDGSPAEPSEPLFHLGDGDYLVGVSMNTIEYQYSYAHQLRYLNVLMREAITKLRKADPNAIIIIQGDHGPGSHFVARDILKNNMVERASILNAIYLPEGGREDLYDTITPVNTFRLIMNHYFGGDYELLPDRTFFSESMDPYAMFELNFGSPEASEVAQSSEVEFE